MYAVAGVTGQTGRAVAQALRDAGAEVRALVRKPEQAEALAKEGFDTRVLDLGDTDKLTAALSGLQGAYLLLPPFYGEGVIGHQDRVARSIGGALGAAELPRVVLLSSIGAQHPSGTGPIVPCHRLEHHAADVPNVTFLRAGYFLENWLLVADAVREHGVLPTFLSSEKPFPMVATLDIGRIAAALLLAPQAPPNVVQVAGPADVPPAHVAAAFFSVLGKEVAPAEQPLSAVADTFEGAGVPRELAELFQEMYEAAAAGRLTWESTDVVRGHQTAQHVLHGALRGSV